MEVARPAAVLVEVAEPRERFVRLDVSVLPGSGAEVAVEDPEAVRFDNPKVGLSASFGGDVAV
jgi:hypothetical protein